MVLVNNTICPDPCKFTTYHFIELIPGNGIAVSHWKALA
jgi:hypothetical protein